MWGDNESDRGLQRRGDRDHHHHYGVGVKDSGGGGT